MAAEDFSDGPYPQAGSPSGELSPAAARPLFRKRPLKDPFQDDVELIETTLAGDASAYGQLVSKHQDRLFNTLRHVLGSAEDAEDIVQEAFVQAFVKLDTFRGGSAFYTWLYRIAFNQAMTLKRRAKPTDSIDQAREATGGEPVDPGDQPEERILRTERVEQVHTALASLGEEHRAILVLREMDGCCYETISEILELPIGTVRSRLHRARMQLKEQLREVLQEESH
jgi:RNA polymerase sigma-70 factor (ECF subfamily)